MSTAPIIRESGAYLRSSSAVVSFVNSTDATKPTTTQTSDEISGDYVEWGPTNDYPKKLRLKVEKSTTAAPLIRDHVARKFGRGLVYYKKKHIDGGIEYEFPEIDEINEFIFANDINYLMLERMMDYDHYNNCFAEFIKNLKNDKINRVYHLEAEFCRFGKLNDAYQSKEIWYCGDWEKQENVQKIPYATRRDVQRGKHIDFKTKFATHSCFPSPGRTFYASSPMSALTRENGWLDYSNSVPEIMNAVNRNAMNIKYHIKIPDVYWRSTEKNWDTLPREKQKEIQEKKLKEMDEWLTGTENAGKAFMSHFATDPINGKPVAGWEISVLDDKIKKDVYLTSLQEADTQTARATRTDPSLAGIQPQGGKMGAGSGSDKRVATHNTIAMSYADIYVLTDVMRVIQQYNGWDPKIEWGFWHDVPVTLNEDPSGTKTET